VGIIKVAKPANKYCKKGCAYLDSTIYDYMGTRSGCVMYGVRLFKQNNLPMRCSECIEKEGKL